MLCDIKDILWCFFARNWFIVKNLTHIPFALDKLSRKKLKIFEFERPAKKPVWRKMHLWWNMLLLLLLLLLLRTLCWQRNPTSVQNVINFILAKKNETRIFKTSSSFNSNFCSFNHFWIKLKPNTIQTVYYEPTTTCLQWPQTWGFRGWSLYTG